MLRQLSKPNQNASSGSGRAMFREEEMEKVEEGKSLEEDHLRQARNLADQKKHSLILRFCKGMNALTGLAALLSLCAQLNVISSSSEHSMSAVESIIRCYGALFCCCAILTETEWSRFFVHFLFFESWLGRGLFYVLTGVMLLPFDDPSEHPSIRPSNFRMFCAYLIICCGVLYFVLGLLCFHYLKEIQMKRIMKIQQAEEEMGDLAHRKQEIERLLQETENKLMRM